MVFPLGMLCAVALYWAIFLLVFGVLQLPKPNDETAVGVVSALVVFALFFLMVYRGGRLAVTLLQRLVLAQCPVCQEAKVGQVFLSRNRGEYRCRACGYVHATPG
jgi:predicted RNA-binding Zn-ribbon protein involved in translation (DUF1610 family)